MPYEPPPELAGLTLAQIAEQVAQRKLPPVEGWAPQQEGDSRMRIAADGTWFHDGSPITRGGMVRAFSGLLTRDEAGRHWLVTPFEKLAIEVEDACFIATDVSERDEALAFRLNTDELVVAGPDNPIRVAGTSDEPAAYVMVRRGCEARLNRSTWAQIAEIAIAQGSSEDGGWMVSSQGETFPLVPQ